MTRSARLDLLTVGEAFQDLIFVGLPHLPRNGEELKTARFAATIGGGAIITAVAAARLGVRAGVISGVSREAVRRLRDESVRVVNVKRASEAHAVTVSLSTAHDRSFVTFNGMNDRLEPRLAGALARQRARHVHFAFAPGDCLRWAQTVDRLRAAGTTTSWDFGWHPPLRSQRDFRRLAASVDVLFVNEIEASMYAGGRGLPRAIAFWRRSARNAVIKLGSRGSRWIADGLDISAAAPRVRPIDTTGAGDAFNGGFLTAYLDGEPPPACLRIGNLVGARSTLAAGGLDALPRRSQLR